MKEYDLHRQRVVWDGMGYFQRGTQNSLVSGNLHNTLLELEGESIEKVY